MSCEGPDSVAVPVAPHEQAALGIGQAPQKVRQQFPQLTLGRVGYPQGGGQLQGGLLQLPQVQTAAVLAVAVNGQIPQNGGQIGLQRGGTLGGNGAPEGKVGIVDALLGIGAVVPSQNAEGEVEAEASVVPLGLGDGALVTLEV